MHAVILAAGRGSRMGSLTDERPKALLPVAGDTLLGHKLRALPPEIGDVVIVVGYLGDMIRAEIGEAFAGHRIRYIEQTKLDGDAAALSLARPFLSGDFLTLMGDDLIAASDLRILAMQTGWAMLASRIEGEFSGGRIDREGGKLVGLTEGKSSRGGLVWTGAAKLDEAFFSSQLVRAPGGEVKTSLTLASLAGAKPISVIDASFWLQTNSPEELARAERFLRREPANR